MELSLYSQGEEFYVVRDKNAAISVENLLKRECTKAYEPMSKVLCTEVQCIEHVCSCDGPFLARLRKSGFHSGRRGSNFHNFDRIWASSALATEAWDINMTCSMAKLALWYSCGTSHHG